jgi:integrase
MTVTTDPMPKIAKPLWSSRRRRRKSPNGAGGVYFNQSTGRWMGRYTTDDPETGLSVRKAVYGHSEQEARAKLIEALAARQTGSLLVGRGRELTVGQYAERWLAGLRKRPTTRARYRQALDHVIGDDRLGNLALTKLRPQHVKGLLAALHAGTARTSPKPLKSRSCNRVRDVLRNMLNDAMRDGRVARNAAELAKPLPLDDVSRRVILKPEHFPAFVEMCERHDMGGLWMLALCTARRESELLGLRWTDVVWERGELRVERQLKRLNGSWYLEGIKTGERGESTIRLPEIAVDVLRRHRARQDETRSAVGPSWSGAWPQLIFTVMDVRNRQGPGRRPSGRPGDPLQPTTISKAFPTAVVAAGLPRLRFHDLRHSSASFLLHMGIPPLEVARILGHSSVTTTMTIYAHAIEEQTSPRAAQVMNDALRRTDAKHFSAVNGPADKPPSA